MLIDNEFISDDTMNFQDFHNFEFSPILDESADKKRAPFTPNSGGFPPLGNYPPNFNFNPPNFDYDNSPNFNYPGGGVFNPPGAPKSPPPNYVPRKNDSGVQKVGVSGGVNAKAVSSNSIRFCLYKYTYIWEENGNNYWTFLLSVNRRTVSGFRWFRRNWVYFGLDLRRIDSFICYRSDSESEEKCNDCIDLNRSDKSLLLNNQKEYSLNGSKDVYTKTLASIDIPDIKEDVMTKTIGYLDDNEITSEMPCVKARNICYRINLEVTYPSNYDINLKRNINKLVEEASNDAYEIISLNRNGESSFEPLETFNLSAKSIPDAFKAFSDSFSSKLNLLNSTINLEDITYCIRHEKIYNNWKPYFYNDSLY